jgi:glycosyltransferase involved in cell wall biosynthesis
LVVANRKPHKNIEAAVSLLAALRRSDPSLRLVLIGEQFAHWEHLVAHARASGVFDAIEDRHNLSDAQLVALYQGAVCLVLPSRYEGFGLPVLEAFACGTPVVASNVTAVPEVAGDAALLCSPDDILGMADAVARLRTDRAFRAELVRRGRARAALFTWDRTAQGMEQYLLEASEG